MNMHTDAITFMNGTERPAVLNGAVEDRDLLLVSRFVAGDEKAFDQLVARYQAYVYGICLRMLGHPNDAEDAAQMVFISIYKSLHRFNRRAKVSTWIYRIAVNQCISRHRSRRPEVAFDTEFGAWSQPIEEYEKHQAVRDVLAQLPPHFRAVLVLRYYQEMSYEEIADILEWSVAKVKCYLHRARNKFRQSYEIEDGGGEAV